MRAISLMALGLASIVHLAAAEAVSGVGPATEPKVDARLRVVAQLGKEHIAHAIHRAGRNGERIVAWGDRILEWPLTSENPPLKEVVPVREGFSYSNGGCAMDLDGDGIDEVVVARGRGRWGNDPELLWFEEGRAGWIEHRIAELGRGPVEPHDILPISFKGTGDAVLRGVVLVIGRRQLVWFEEPRDPREPWTRHEIASVDSSTSEQSGMAVGDIAGHGRPDIAWGMFWAECPADPLRQTWTLHRFGDWNDGGWAGMAKVALADMDGDGQIEIVAAEAEIPEARLGIFRRVPGHPDKLWTCQQLDKGLYCPHSLVLTDLDGDGQWDIVVGEMTAGGWSFPINPKPRILVYCNRGGSGFVRRTLAEGWGVHEMGMLTLGKDRILYAADEIQPQKFPDMKTHIVAWFLGK